MARVALLMAALCALSAPAAAQGPETREAEHKQQQEQKAASVKPYAPHWFEKRLLEIQQQGGFGVARGWFVAFGDIKSGSSFAMGPAYTKWFDNDAMVQAKAGYSIRNFKLAQVSFAAPPIARGRVDASGRLRWQDAPTLALYPLGANSRERRFDFSETKTEVSGRVNARPVSFVRVGAGIGYEAFDTTIPTLRKPSASEPLDILDVPGIGTDPRYVHSQVTGALDWRDGLGYSRRGTLLQATLHDYRQENGDGLSFRRVDGAADQYIPMLHGNWVIYLGVRASTTTADDGNRVPFYLLPKVGGSDLRGFSNYRFRDRHSVVFTAEYRWYVQEFVDFALFYDAGKVASRRSELDFDGLKSSVGAGIRFHGPQTTALRLEVARSSEGFRLLFAFSPVGG